MKDCLIEATSLYPDVRYISYNKDWRLCMVLEATTGYEPYGGQFAPDVTPPSDSPFRTCFVTISANAPPPPPTAPSPPPPWFITSPPPPPSTFGYKCKTGWMVDYMDSSAYNPVVGGLAYYIQTADECYSQAKLEYPWATAIAFKYEFTQDRKGCPWCCQVKQKTSGFSNNGRRLSHEYSSSNNDAGKGWMFCYEPAEAPAPPAPAPPSPAPIADGTYCLGCPEQPVVDGGWSGDPCADVRCPMDLCPDGNARGLVDGDCCGCEAADNDQVQTYIATCMETQTPPALEISFFNNPDCQNAPATAASTNPAFSGAFTFPVGKCVPDPFTTGNWIKVASCTDGMANVTSFDGFDPAPSPAPTDSLPAEPCSLPFGSSMIPATGTCADPSLVGSGSARARARGARGRRSSAGLWCSVYDDDPVKCNNAYVQFRTGLYAQCVTEYHRRRLDLQRVRAMGVRPRLSGSGSYSGSGSGRAAAAPTRARAAVGLGRAVPPAAG